MQGFTVVVPARNEAELLPATLAGLSRSAHAGPVVVVDDGSTDATAALASAGGASVLTLTRSRGKAAAVMAGVEHATREGLRGEAGVLLLDADVGGSVEGLEPVMAAVAAGECDLAIARYVARGATGGHGLVVGLARRGIASRTGFTAGVPLSGIRAMTWPAWEAVSPLARGWGVETGMTIDALRAGMRVAEVETTMTHRATGAGLRAQVHRGRQYVDVHRALWARRPARRLPAR